MLGSLATLLLLIVVPPGGAPSPHHHHPPTPPPKPVNCDPKANPPEQVSANRVFTSVPPPLANASHARAQPPDHDQSPPLARSLLP